MKKKIALLAILIFAVLMLVFLYFYNNNLIFSIKISNPQWTKDIAMMEKAEGIACRINCVGIDNYNFLNRFSTIHKLHLENGNFVDLVFLKKMENLNGLICSGNNKLESIADLQNLPNLKFIVLEGAEKIKDLSYITKLEHLDELTIVGGNRVGIIRVDGSSKDEMISPQQLEQLKGLKVKDVFIQNANVGSLDFLESMPDGSCIFFLDCTFSDPSELKKLPDTMLILDLCNTNIDDISFLSGKRIGRLNLVGSPAKDKEIPSGIIIDKSLIKETPPPQTGPVIINLL